MSSKIIIGITDCNKYVNYNNWMLQNSDTIEVIKLSYHQNNLDKIKKCRGLILTGGEDVHPRFFGKPEYFEFCYKDEVDEARDEFELNLLSYTEANSIPVLGI